MLSPVFPWPAISGDRVRIASLLEWLIPFWQITFVAPIMEHVEERSRSVPTSLRAEIVPVITPRRRLRQLRGVLSLSPYHCHYFASLPMRRLVRERLCENTYDLIYCHFLHSLSYLPDEVNVPILVDQQNVDIEYWRRKAAFSRGIRRLVSFWNFWKVRRYELRWLDRIWAYVSVSEEDSALTRAYAEPAVRHFFTAQNGVDVRVFAPIDWSERRLDGTVTLVFLGSLYMDFNRQAAERLCLDLFPRIRAQAPEIDFRLVLIGPSPSRRLMALASQDPAITVTGAVEAVPPWLHKADIFVAPLRDGAGTKLKTVEAMACALPVVGTPLALQGVQGEDGVHYRLASQEADFVQAVCDLARSPHERVEMGNRARRLVEGTFDWSWIGHNLAESIGRALRPGDGVRST